MSDVSQVLLRSMFIGIIESLYLSQFNKTNWTFKILLLYLSEYTRYQYKLPHPVSCHMFTSFLLDEYKQFLVYFLLLLFVLNFCGIQVNNHIIKHLDRPKAFTYRRSTSNHPFSGNR